MTLTIEEAIARVPLWITAADLKATPLSGAITNENFCIKVDDDVFILCTPGVEPELLGSICSTKYSVSQASGNTGISSEVFLDIEPI